MPRFFFEISYLGTPYNGWQSQSNATGVQSIVEKAMSTVLRETVAVVASGRTDTGVHCAQQFFHADIEKPFDTSKLIVQLNSFLPKFIAIRSIRKVKPDASARYDAVERSYVYRITRVKDPLAVGYSYYYFKAADVKAMNRAAALLIGTHDFQCFSKVKTDVNHFVCTIKSAKWNQKGDSLVFTIVANRFLRGMVRAVVGTLLDVGSGKLTVADFRNIIRSKDRGNAGMNVPPEGLYLMKVKYPRSVFAID
jgi:tRNA pseudouridine38-40 synthase